MKNTMENELYHYGIKGQKWGIRNYQREDGSYTAKGQAENKGHGRYSGNVSETSTKNKNQNGEKVSPNLSQNVKNFLSNEKTKKAIKIGAACVAAIAVGYSLNYISTTSSLNVISSDFAKEIASVQFDCLKPNFTSLKELPKTNIFNSYFSEDHSSAVKNLLSGNNVFPDDMLRSMVSDYKKGRLDSSLYETYKDELLGGRTNNCMLCTTSLAMRLKGYYVEAAKVLSGQGGVGPYITENLFKNTKVENPKKNTINGVLKELSKSGPGSYGNLMVQWLTGGGHSILYTVENDGVHFLDGQLNKEYTAHELFSKTNILATQFARLDNCEPTDMVLKAISKVGSDIIFA